MPLFKKITETISALDPRSIAEERKAALELFIDFVQHKLNAGQEMNINFICTHNSRRSHLSQVWAQVLAHHFGIKDVFCYSGGTESTALFPMVVQTLEGAGFEISKIAESVSNPVYSIKYAENAHPVIGFSKKLDSDFNPTSSFLAIMTCSQADEGCPVVLGAESRIPITFDDPKAFDGTPQQAEKYAERSLQIATEWYYVFSKIELKQ